MNEPLIVIFPRGQLSELDKARLDEKGIVAIEADDPNSIQQLRISRPMTCEGLTGDAIVTAALRAIAGQPCETGSSIITSAGRAAHSFVSALAEVMSNQAQKGDDK